jgi:serine protease Do
VKTALAASFILIGAAVAQVSFVGAADAVRPSLVSIVADKVELKRSDNQGAPEPVQTQGLGSGFVLDTLGHIMTCHHVVADFEDVTVKFSDDAAYGGENVLVIGVDPVTDLAVIQVKAKRRFAPARLGNSDELQVGQPVMAMGSPFGLEGTATAGIVSGLSRWGLGKSSGPDFQAFVQTDALVNPGNSGGPLVDLEGKVVGVSSFVRTIRSGPTGIGFATPINLARSVADQLIRNGKVIRGYLGISTQPVTEGIRQALGLQDREGVLVTAVEPGLPGAKAGLLAGDALVAIDGVPIPDVRWFQSEVAARKPGTEARLTLIRKGRPGVATATLDTWPADKPEPRSMPPPRNWLGLVVRDATQVGPDRGIIIAEVEGGSPADRADLRPGDIVSEVNLAPVRNEADFDKIAKVMAGTERALLFRVSRGRQAFYTAVKP